MPLELAALLVLIFTTGVQTEGPITVKTVVSVAAIVIITVLSVYGRL